MNDASKPTVAAAERRSLRLWLIIGILFVLAFTNLFLRSSLGVMAPELSRELTLSPAALSTVSSAFFFAYAFMQVPTGMLLDRFGARATITGMLLFTTAGAAAFAAAHSVAGLAFGRVLMGIGCAGIFTGAFYVLALWLPQGRVVAQMGWLNSFAAVGTLTATTPLAALIALLGWRDSYWLFTCGVGLLLVGIWAIVRDGPPGLPPQAARSESIGDVVRGAGEALRQPGMWRLLLMGLPISATSTLSGVWGAPYLRDVHGLDAIGRGNVLLAMALSAIAGHTSLGMLARRVNSLKTAMITGMTGVITAMGAMALAERPPVLLVAGLLCVCGFFASFPMIVFAHARGLVAPNLMGRGLSAANMGVMMAIATMQIVFGGLVGALSAPGGVPPEIAYRAGFAAQAVVAVLALLVYLPIRDVRPRA
ncbi:MAG: MFS transporter [Hyphomicrobiaceae bacterium]|nr:MFS transporter [Hyphomicrobiaceae bacterium]